jgi:Lrp/AsnC family leucine-responsive transcriptional regulator
MQSSVTAYENELDELDFALLEKLMRDGRATWADLASELGLTAPAVANRVRRLQDRGIIQQFAACVNPAEVAPVTAYLFVGIAQPQAREGFLETVRQSDIVQECHQVSGDQEFLLKARFATVSKLNEYLNQLRECIGPGGTLRNTFVLSTLKESTVLPIRGT